MEARYRRAFPDWQVVYGGCGDGPFNRAEAILDAAALTTADHLVVADADAWCDDIAAAVAEVDAHGWAVPHARVHRLSPQSTERVLAGEEWSPGAMPLSSDNRHDSRPHAVSPTGLIFAIHRDVLESVPPDRRFVGWGQEDEAWRAALECLVGLGWRGGGDALHLWHPPQPRRTRLVGSREGERLRNRYRRAVRQPDRMRALIEEGRTWTSPASSTSPAPS